MTYCVVPPDTAGRVKRSIERAARGATEVKIVIERRQGDRRVRVERRRSRQHVPRLERRRIGYEDGRRVSERRATLIPAAVPESMARAIRHAPDARFVEPLEVPPEFRRDVEAVRAIVRFQSGQNDHGELYERWFDPLYTYLSVTLQRGADVEAYVARALADALHEACVACPESTQVRAWLFGLAYRSTRPRRPELTRVAAPTAAGGPARADADQRLAWLTDDDLVLLVERRPPAERHVVVLRYFVGLSFAEIASIMAIEPAGVVALHRSAVASLDATLSGVSRSPRMEERHPMGRLVHQTPALRQRRRALLAA